MQGCSKDEVFDASANTSFNSAFLNSIHPHLFAHYCQSSSVRAFRQDVEKTTSMPLCKSSPRNPSNWSLWIRVAFGFHTTSHRNTSYPWVNFQYFNPEGR
ncbi:hypothetical protein MIND_00908900 [Mycena indigotica]|uniref:Uncharacterized protein n=1 Tax=Mycena indigotica TaxID=2126181 RepID=A0A8H6SC17_9AGAR|nr:uncharacterized protein MIND_00908900 [Mycena indigotica]KAF7296781.1 hypothetical protein MIND_00908900 [Mycena indigotica]